MSILKRALSTLLGLLLLSCGNLMIKPMPIPPVVEQEKTLWVKLIDALNEQCPLSAPTFIQVAELDGPIWGDCRWDGLVYVIRIESRQCMPGKLNTLIHEWAHAMIWNASQRESDEDHGPLWGVAYARSYRALMSIK